MLFKVAQYSFDSLCACTVARFLGRHDACCFHTHTEFLILQNLDFVNLLAIFLPLFLQFPSVNFFKIWQHGKTCFQLHDEHFKFTNQKLQYFLTMKTPYFNITEKLARSPSFFSVKFPYSPILNYACKVINYACISFVYKDNRNSREDRIYTYLIILT